MEDRKKTILVQDLLALCYILDDFDCFNTNLRNAMSYKNNGNVIIRLEKVSRGENCFWSKKLKRFYLENCTVIDSINMYSDISSFILLNYDKHLRPKVNGLDFFYQYLLEHRDQINHIKKLLFTLRNLKFKRLEFDETVDWTNIWYTIDTTFSNNFYISYVDNIEVIPNGDKNIIAYQSKNSNYIMKFRTTRLDISENNRQITVNSLLFDIESLPKTINKETIFDEIIKLKENNKQDNWDLIRTSIDFSLSIMDLDRQFCSTDKIICGLENVKSKKELIEILSYIKGYINRLETLSQEFDEQLLEDIPLLTKDTLVREKKLYLQKICCDKKDIL